MVNKNINVSLPEEIIKKLEKKIKEIEFDSISDYLVYVLKEVLKNDADTEINAPAYTEEEEQAVKNRLKELGYI